MDSVYVVAEPSETGGTREGGLSRVKYVCHIHLHVVAPVVHCSDVPRNTDIVLSFF